MAPAIEFFVQCALTGCLRHGNNPVLTASVLNAVQIPDKAGNPMIDKSRAKVGPVRVDGAVALVMALGTAHRVRGEPKPKFQMMFV
jgi:phage terminase large subunit-like protein